MKGGWGRGFEHNQHVLLCARKRRAITIVDLVFNGKMLRRRLEYRYVTAGKRASMFPVSGQRVIYASVDDSAVSQGVLH
jgi:hypothetical protein